MMDRPSPSPDLAALLTRLARETGPRLWRSLEEAADAPEARRLLEAEFPDLASVGAIDRRTWIRLMGASLAAAGLAACDTNDPAQSRPLLSQAGSTPGYTPGVGLTLATSLERDGTGCGVLVTAQEGRPIKVEGNPLHPATRGASDPFLQAEVLTLNDPSRSTHPAERGEARSWADMRAVLRQLRTEAVADGGTGLHLVLPPVASPTLERLAAAARELLPRARWHAYAPILDDQRIAGARLAFGRPLDLVYDLAAADTIVCLGGDLFSTEPGHIRYAADFQARRRTPDRPLPMLVAVEAGLSLVGARADERVVVRPREMEAFVRALAATLGIAGEPPGEAHPAAARIAARLRATGGHGLVTVGREQPAVVHALAAAVNERLGAFGQTVRAIEPVLPAVEGIASITSLADAVAAGTATRVLILGGNPVYDAPADLELASLIRRLPASLHVGCVQDETAACCRWHVPRPHAFESFGDLRAFDGTVGFSQPATVRAAPSLGPEEFLSLLCGLGGQARDVLAQTWRDRWADRFEERFDRALEDGVVPGTASDPVAARVLEQAPRSAPQSTGPGALDIAFVPDPATWDGRYANNGWLQELPRPLSKQVWGNAAMIAPETAARFGLRSQDVVEIASGGRVLSAPVWVQPGHAPDTLTLPLGYGRSRAGALGNGVGFDAYRLRTAEAPWLATGDLRPLGRRERLITTQQHHAMHGRDLVRTVAEDPRPAQQPGEPSPSFYPEKAGQGHAWGMAIDLDACIGCNACVVACQAENNVPVVGPDEAARGREMHWLRIDRYHAGDPSAPKTYFQPVPCMHCETAPCEVVCPVNATVHSSEGLNDMVYNRCIGTRTCSNNCPYKVRRFNFHDNRTGPFSAAGSVLNPQVTARPRGVMEKCTYCIQRIAAARIEARIEDRPVADGEVVTACQQACPTRAISFGDIASEDSAVARQRRSARGYALLGDLNTKPRTTYLARIEPQAPAPGGDPAKDGE